MFETNSFLQKWLIISNNVTFRFNNVLSTHAKVALDAQSFHAFFVDSYKSRKMEREYRWTYVLHMV